MGHRLYTSMDLLKPDVGKRVKRKQEGMMQRNGGRERKFSSGELVLVKGLGLKNGWIEGVIKEAPGAVLYVVRLKDGRLVKRHVEQIHRKNKLSQELVEYEDNENISTSASDLNEEVESEIVNAPVPMPSSPTKETSNGTSSFQEGLPAENPFSSKEGRENSTSHTPTSVTTTLAEKRDSYTSQDIELSMSSRPTRVR